MFSNPLIRKLQNFVRFSEAEEMELQRLVSERRSVRGPHEELLSQGMPPDRSYVVLQGWACHYRDLSNGRRQITALCLPGDLCLGRVSVMSRLSHSIGSLSAVTLGQLSPGAVEELLAAYPRIAQAMAWQSEVQESIQREWVVNLGQRGASERMAHLFCEIHWRLRLVDLVEGDSCEMPLTQADIAEIMGLSAVHVNRVLQELRSAGLIVLRGRSLRIPDLAALREAAMFDPVYLHAEREGRHLDANA
ncbi:Crp/Fnr family transcriptional regulator [Roseococcus sp. SYP-B2431]|uniref:Crp/Fnr family transcriptional regulator n=1 Tax=Roseococcus sp. SYP-B2431 TaxID=2496640 RepID=UPI00103B7D86|nr:Crp/Fnr family transcriptional regulator [Roseococcus sp. SYP-B2431]TCH98125.1 Crp/Fnr family transcriptional regulator [Roseococcus sp. SYP-B2431]